MAFLFGTAAVAGVAWGYLSKLSFVSNAKYYVSQQLAQMQAHYYNRFRIEFAARQRDRKLGRLVEQIFEDYKKDIYFDEWCWIKIEKNGEYDWKCVKNGPLICPTEKFGGIFPPIASLESTVKPCSTKIKSNGWLTDWKNALKGYGTGYFSNLEYYVLQLEALEQDMALMKPKLKY
jgi:hypothetical protein